jgi:hypothetical protein
MKKYLILVVLGVLMACKDGPPYYWHACIEDNNQIYLVHKWSGGGASWNPNYYVKILPNGKLNDTDIRILFLKGTVDYLFANDSSISVSLHAPVEQLLTSKDFICMRMGFMENGSDAVIAYFQSMLGNSTPTSPYPIKPIPYKTINYKIEGKLIFYNRDTIVINSSGTLIKGNWQGNWQGKQNNTGF